MTVQGLATTMAVSCLVLLIQASDCAPRACPPPDEVVKPEPIPQPALPKSDAEHRPAPSSETPVPALRAETPQPETPRHKEATAPTSSPTPPPVSTPVKPPAPALPPVSTAVTPAPLDLSLLEKRLRDTSAIGVFTKLSLKNQVDDLLEQVAAYHAGRSQVPLAKLRESFDLLLLKVLSLLQDKDPALASDVSASREALWNLLADPAKFANL